MKKTILLLIMVLGILQACKKNNITPTLHTSNGFYYFYKEAGGKHMDSLTYFSPLPNDANGVPSSLPGFYERLYATSNQIVYYQEINGSNSLCMFYGDSSMVGYISYNTMYNNLTNEWTTISKWINPIYDNPHLDTSITINTYKSVSYNNPNFPICH